MYGNLINNDAEMWKDDDKKIDYSGETRKSILSSIAEGAVLGADIGGVIGGIFGGVGETIGRRIGTII